MRHKSDGERHQTDKHCIFQHQYQNFAYLCKVSIKNGTKFLIFPRNVNISHVTELSFLADVPLEGELCSTVTLCTVNNNIIAEHCIFQITLSCLNLTKELLGSLFMKNIQDYAIYNGTMFSVSFVKIIFHHMSLLKPINYRLLHLGQVPAKS